MRINMSAFMIIITLSINLFSYTELVPDFDRKESRAMVRKIEKPTRAALDYAAYDKNPVLFEQKEFDPENPEEEPRLESITFGDVAAGVCNSIEDTPLTEMEKAMPLAWEPLVKHLWEVTKDPGFQALTSKINGYKWADKSIYAPYQEVVTVWLHETDGETEWWAKIEFKPWADFLSSVTDGDSDGFPEIYAKLTLSDISSEKKEAAQEWIREKYCGERLDREDVVDWATSLASYWYPTKNTDMVEMGDSKVWPNENTPRRVRRSVDGLEIKNPVAVMRGKPYGKPIYNVFVVETYETADKEKTDQYSSAAGQKSGLDTSLSNNFKTNNKRFREETAKYESYDEWAESLDRHNKGLKTLLDSLPEEQMGIEGKDGWLFFRHSLEYSSAGDITVQPDKSNPVRYLKELKSFLNSRNINLLFLPVPVKSEVYYEKLPCETAEKSDIIMNPYSRKMLKAVQDAGIEVIDLLPVFLETKTEKEHYKKGALYQKQDTHWTPRGMEIAAEIIADRIREYDWYKDFDSKTVDFYARDTVFTRQGDIVQRLPEKNRSAYPPAELKGKRVYFPDGKRYKSSPDYPVLLMGDSFTGIFELIDCKSAGIGSHIALLTGIPVDIVTSWGGGPLVRNKMLRMRKKYLPHKRVVIYTMVMRDLYKYSQGWDKLEVE